MLRQTPMMAEGIRESAIAITPELILKRHGDLTTCGNRPLEIVVHISAVDEKITGRRRFGIWIRRGRHLWVFITQHELGVADLQFSVSNLSIWSFHTIDFFCSQRLLVKIDGLRGIFAS